MAPLIIGPTILSPSAFIPIILSPRILAPSILSPGMFEPQVLSPVLMNPSILSPVHLNNWKNKLKYCECSLIYRDCSIQTFWHLIYYRRPFCHLRFTINLAYWPKNPNRTREHPILQWFSGFFTKYSLAWWTLRACS